MSLIKLIQLSLIILLSRFSMLLILRILLIIQLHHFVNLSVNWVILSVLRIYQIGILRHFFSDLRIRPYIWINEITLSKCVPRILATESSATLHAINQLLMSVSSLLIHCHLIEAFIKGIACSLSGHFGWFHIETFFGWIKLMLLYLLSQFILSKLDWLGRLSFFNNIRSRTTILWLVRRGLHHHLLRKIIWVSLLHLTLRHKFSTYSCILEALGLGNALIYLSWVRSLVIRIFIVHIDITFIFIEKIQIVALVFGCNRLGPRAWRIAIKRRLYIILRWCSRVHKYVGVGVFEPVLSRTFNWWIIVMIKNIGIIRSWYIWCSSISSNRISPSFS